MIRAASQRYIQTSPRRGYRFIAELELVAPAERGRYQRFTDEARRTFAHPGKRRAAQWRSGVGCSCIGEKWQRHSQSCRRGSRPGANCLPSHQNDICRGQSSTELLGGCFTGLLCRDRNGSIGHRTCPEFSNCESSPGSIISRQKAANRASFPPADEPKLDMLVEGSVVRRANQVRVMVQVFRLPARAQIWSQTYDRDLGEILAVQKEVAWTIAAQVSEHLTPHEQSHFSFCKSHQAGGIRLVSAWDDSMPNIKTKPITRQQCSPSSGQ